MVLYHLISSPVAQECVGLGNGTGSIVRIVRGAGKRWRYDMAVELEMQPPTICIHYLRVSSHHHIHHYIYIYHAMHEVRSISIDPDYLDQFYARRKCTRAVYNSFLDEEQEDINYIDR